MFPLHINLRGCGVRILMDQDSSNDKADMGVATTHARKAPGFPLRKMATHGAL